MSKLLQLAGNQAHIIPIELGIDCIILRRFNPHTDSWNRLTSLLHRAFAPLVELDLPCRSSMQSSGVTRRRALAGDCFVAVCRGHIVGTMTLEGSDPISACPHYRESTIASLHQFCIDPAWQHCGIGSALIAFAEQWAVERGYTRLALDTPFDAVHLVEFYRGLGFSLVEAMRFPEREYESAVLDKPLEAGDRRVRARSTRQGQQRTVLACASP